jgi:hypothetical protein
VGIGVGVGVNLKTFTVAGGTKKLPAVLNSRKSPKIAKIGHGMGVHSQQSKPGAHELTSSPSNFPSNARTLNTINFNGN